MLAQTAAALLAIAHSTGAEVAQEASRVTSNLPQYEIDMRIDFRTAKLSGRQRVSLINSSREATENLFFHLYPNVGIDNEGPLTLNVLSVSIGERRAQFALQGRSTVLRVNLPEKLAPGAECIIEIEFSATVPSVPKEETSLISHFLEEISDAMGEQSTSRARREFFFKSGNTMLLGYFFPLLAEGDIRDPERLPIGGIKGVVYSDLANFDVKVETESDLNVISSGELVSDGEIGRGVANPSVSGLTRKWRFKGHKLRSFALVLAEKMKRLDRDVGGVRLTSYVRPEDERIGLQVLATAAKAIETYGRTFGPHPYPSLKVVEVPLPASFSGIDLPGIVALADAYYIDFESKQQDLPSIVREQADVIKSALEFTLVHEIAHSWWGGAVGSDPQRAPYVDEALAHFSAIYFYELNPGDTSVESVIDQQVRGTYYAYRLFGGTDMEVERPLKDFKTRIQYAAIVQAKGAFLLIELRRELGDERFFKTLREYYNENRFRMSTPERLRNAFIQASPDPRAMRAQLRRWLNEKHGDEDIGSPPATLVTQPGGGMKKLGRVFVWIGRTAARPF
jgi:Peptidase family M1 domain